MPGKIRKAVFPVAGLGTRFLPATKAVPKEMLTVVDRPVIQHVVDEAREAGIEHFVFVTGRNKGVIEDHFDKQVELESVLRERGKTAELELLARDLPGPGQTSFTRQQTPLGLGHAVWCARHMAGDGPFLVMSPDDLVMSDVSTAKQLIDAHEMTGGNVVAVMDVPREHTNRYGVLDTDNPEDKLPVVKGMVEKPDPSVAPSTLSIIAHYLLMPEVFDELARHERGAGNEIQLTDAMARLIGKQPFHGLRFEGTRFDCGTKEGWLEANIAFGLKRADLGGKVADIVKKYANS